MLDLDPLVFLISLFFTVHKVDHDLYLILLSFQIDLIDLQLLFVPSYPLVLLKPINRLLLLEDFVVAVVGLFLALLFLDHYHFVIVDRRLDPLNLLLSSPAALFRTLSTFLLLSDFNDDVQFLWLFNHDVIFLLYLFWFVFGVGLLFTAPFLLLLPLLADLFLLNASSVG